MRDTKMQFSRGHGRQGTTADERAALRNPLSKIMEFGHDIYKLQTPSGNTQDLSSWVPGIDSAVQTTLVITTMSPFKIISPISFLINNKPFRRQRSRAVPPANSEPEPDETHLPAAQEIWSFPRVNIAKLGAIFWCFLLLGSNDSSYGVSARFPSHASDEFLN